MATREIFSRLRERLAPGGFVLLVGDSTAGKTRAAFEAMAATLPKHAQGSGLLIQTNSWSMTL
jgi:tRNA A37 threonylcarbamoyladenosine biosynthesis protein TsaE